MYSIEQFGAVSNGTALATKAIQAAIDTCHANGGGRVLIPSGTYLTGSLFLKSNVELHLEHGAMLKASTDLSDYNAADAYAQNFGSAFEEWTAKHLIIAVECQNVALTGDGVIDGSGNFFFEEPKFYPEHAWMSGYAWRNGISFARDKTLLRPGQVVCMIECENVTVTGITIQNSPCWSLFLHGCEQVTVRGIKVLNPAYFGNSDGIDIDCCRYVTVSDCIIRTGDDAIAIRCDSKRLKKPCPCEYVTISNCTLSASACGIRVGVGYGIIQHVRVFGITIENAGYGINYITSYSARGCAEIEDVNFSDISIYNAGFPIQIKGEVGAVRNISLESIRAYTLGGVRLVANGACDISRVRMRDLDIHLIPDSLPLDEHRLQIRGDALLHLQGVHDVCLNGVRIDVTPELLLSWKTALSQTECTNVQMKNCSLPTI